MLLYRLNSDLGTFLVDSTTSVYNPTLKGVKFYSDKQSFSKWLWISLVNATNELGGKATPSEMLVALDYRMEVYEVEDSVINENKAIESQTYNSNTKREYMLDDSTKVTLKAVLPIREVEDWDTVFPSSWRN